MLRCFASTAGGLSELLKDELHSLGAQALKVQPKGVAFSASLQVLYQACLWSRLANRIFLIILDTEVVDQEDLTAQVAELDWLQHMQPEQTFAVSFSGQGVGIDHSHYGALTIKDGIIDFFHNAHLERPRVDTHNANIRIHGHLNRKHLSLSIDLIGYSLHQRGYREGQQVGAPLKENVAAALLMRAGWPQIAQQGGTLYDPMCGSGTFLVEAAMMASDCAPGLQKAGQMLLNNWSQHNPKLWQDLITQAKNREAAGLRQLPSIYGSDVSHKSLDIAHDVIFQAGYDDYIEIKPMNVAQGRRWGDWPTGLIISNPPYGERLGDVEEVKLLYTQLGEFLKHEFSDWQAAILTCHAELGMQLGLKAKRTHNFFNGPLECKLLRFDVRPEFYREPALKGGANLVAEIQQTRPHMAEFAGAKMFANRLRKNLKGLKKWLKKEAIYAYRVYDADMPEYALSIDVYQTFEAGEWLVVNEYAAPKTVDKGNAKKRLHEALSVLPMVFPQINPEQMLFKVRERQSGKAQYTKLDESKAFYTTQENGCKLRVNFTDYMDTGLFLDHRAVRAYVAQRAVGRSLLNLFCYTATASVQAAVAGAKHTLSVDMSKTYLYWAEHNFMHNHIDLRKGQHRLEQADVLHWLDTQSLEARESPEKAPQFEVIFMDPPSFSTSKRMQQTLDIQRDHVALIQQAMALLAPGGELVFSTNLRKFRLDENALNKYNIVDLTAKTMPKDFKQNHNAHQVWVLQ